MRHYDVIVAGLGAMGSSAAYQLARRGLSVLGLDQYHPPHTRGSTHGRTRIIREAYFEDPLYVPLVQRSYELWFELAKRVSTEIIRTTGGLMLGPEHGAVIVGSQASAEANNITHQLLDSAAISRRFPGLTPPPDFVGLWEERAGLLFAETIVSTHLELALESGADLRLGCPLLGWNDEGNSVLARTGLGDFRSTSLVLTAGPWMSRLLPGLDHLFTVERQVSHWFEPVPEMAQWPVTLWEHYPGGLFFTLPDEVDGLKAGVHHEGETVDPDRVDRQTSKNEEEVVRGLLARFMPAANSRLLKSAVCLYTNTPDHHFLLDRHPDSRQVIVVSPCSGHGFKFASVVGEITAELVSQGETRFDISHFGFERLKIT